jgi:AraC-like DNA-binding protein
VPDPLKSFPESDDHLVFSMVRLAPDAEWSNTPSGWRFLLVKQGQALYEVRRVTQRIATGDVLVLHETANGTLRGLPPAEFVACHFRFRPEQLVGLLTLSERRAIDQIAEQQQGLRVYPSKSPFARQFNQLSEQVAVPGTLAHRCLVLQVVATLLNEETQFLRRLPNPAAHVGERIREVVAQLSETQLQHLSVEDLARRCGCGRRHLSRILREYFGCSFLSLKMELRLEKAAALLRSTDDKVINIAMDCGFNHLGLFSARFKRRFGANPSEWRKLALPLDGQARPPIRHHGTLHPRIRVEWPEQVDSPNVTTRA